MDILGFYAFAIMKSMSTLCVTPREFGKVSAVVSAIELASIPGSSQFFVYLWTVSSITTKDTNRKIRKTEFIYNTSVIPKMIPAAVQ